MAHPFLAIPLSPREPLWHVTGQLYFYHNKSHAVRAYYVNKIIS